MKGVLLAGSYHVTLDVLPAAGTFRAPAFSIILRAVIGTLARKKATLRQAGVTLSALEAANVEIFVLNPQNLAAALLLTRLAKCFPHPRDRQEVLPRILFYAFSRNS